MYAPDYLNKALCIDVSTSILTYYSSIHVVVYFQLKVLLIFVQTAKRYNNAALPFWQQNFTSN